jgi:hypothetical protein
MDDTDARRAQREASELHSLVQKAFDDPGSVEPRLEGTSMRAIVRLWAQPSFDDHICWTAWGAGPRPEPQDTGLVRRIVWRQHVDLEPRFDSVRRLALLNLPLRPTLEVTDGTLPVRELSRWISSIPTPAPLGGSMEKAHGLSLDGDRSGVELDDNDVLCHYEWWSGDRHWTPSEPAFDAIAEWSIEFRDWLESQLRG